jgi:hypothetical protein
MNFGALARHHHDPPSADSSIAGSSTISPCLARCEKKPAGLMTCSGIQTPGSDTSFSINAHCGGRAGGSRIRLRATHERRVSRSPVVDDIHAQPEPSILAWRTTEPAFDERAAHGLPNQEVRRADANRRRKQLRNPRGLDGQPRHRSPGA